MGWWGLDQCGSGYGPMEGSCEHDNEPWGSIKSWEVLEWLHNWQLLKKGPAPWVSECFNNMSNCEMAEVKEDVYSQNWRKEQSNPWAAKVVLVDESLRTLKYLTTLLPLTIVESSQKVTRQNIVVGKYSLNFVRRFVQICDITSELGILYNICEI
jgi:hypothetical protein